MLGVCVWSSCVCVCRCACVCAGVCVCVRVFLRCSPPDRRKGRSSSHHSVGLARVDLGEVSVLVRRREVVQRMKRVLGLKIIDK